MRAPRVAAVLVSLVATGAVAWKVQAEKLVMDLPPPDFALEGTGLGGARPPTGADRAAAPHLVGGAIAALADGALVIDGETGDLVRLDDRGAVRDRLAIGVGAAQLVYDPRAGLAYVADRAGDRIVLVEAGARLAARARWTVPTEPYGLALTPDGGTLLVTTVAARRLVALATADGATRWQVPLAAEPRGVAIAPDGARALVSHLSTGTATRVELAGAHATLAIPLSTGELATAAEPLDGARAGRRFARAAFTARFVGNGLALVPHQRSTPTQVEDAVERTGSYGGGFTPPIDHALTIIAADQPRPRTTAASLGAHQPQATAWDPARDRLFIAGYGSDTITVVDDISQPVPRLVTTVALPGAGALGCGPQGLALASGGDLLVYCAVSHTTARVPASAPSSVALGPALGGGGLTPVARTGLDLFRRADTRISGRGALACASCHPEGRADGLSWRIEGHTLQTPLLAGRITGTHPYKWDGGDADLTTSLTSTMRRLGGAGLQASETAALATYLGGLARPRAPARERAQVARGAALFSSLDCTSCHTAGLTTDRERHPLAGSLAEVDTPSLVGLAASAPYYHDGSATSLPALLGERALVHGMSDVALDRRQVADLVAFLETL